MIIDKLRYFSTYRNYYITYINGVWRIVNKIEGVDVRSYLMNKFVSFTFDDRFVYVKDYPDDVFIWSAINYFKKICKDKYCIGSRPIDSKHNFWQLFRVSSTIFPPDMISYIVFTENGLKRHLAGPCDKDDGIIICSWHIYRLFVLTSSGNLIPASNYVDFSQYI